MTIEENASADKLPRGMSSEDMIETLKKLDSGEWARPARGVYASIIAALRAGQAMFKGLERMGKEGRYVDGQANEGWYAWDAATSEPDYDAPVASTRGPIRRVKKPTKKGDDK